MVGNYTLEGLAVLLAAARSPDDSVPRALYCAEARRAFDGAKQRLEELRINLESVEAALKEENHGG
jgi:hypothetical protein